MTTRKLNGYQIHNKTIKLKQDIEIFKSLVKDSMFVFPEESKPSPTETLAQLEELEKELAWWQHVRELYNNTVTLEFKGSTLTLGHAIKLLGFYGRKEKLTRMMLVKPKQRYRDEFIRNTDEIVAKLNTSPKVARQIYEEASKDLLNLRELIQTANATYWEIPEREM